MSRDDAMIRFCELSQKVGETIFGECEDTRWFFTTPYDKDYTRPIPEATVAFIEKAVLARCLSLIVKRNHTTE